MIQEWRGEFSDFRVLDDNKVIPLLKKYFPQYLDLYVMLRIPAAKADVARLLALCEWGGLYVDCHVGIKDASGLRKLLKKLTEFEAIFVDRMLSFAPRPPGEHFLINSIMAGRASLELFIGIARAALTNLARQREIEREKGFTPYHVGDLSGPGVVTSAVLQPGNREIRGDLAGRVLIVREEALPIERNRHQSYFIPGSHWSHRQNSELLFWLPI